MDIEQKTTFTVLKEFLSTKEYNQFRRRILSLGGISGLLYDFNTSILRVEYNPYEVDTAFSKKAVISGGQTPLTFGGVLNAHNHALKNIDAWIKVRLIGLISIAVISLVTVMANNMDLSGYTVLVLLGVLLYGLLLRVHKSAWKYFSFLKIDIYVLFSVAVSVGFVYSALVLFFNDAVKLQNTSFLWKQVTFMAFVFALGMFIRNLEKLNARKRILKILRLKPRFATMAGETEKEHVAVADLKADDLVIVRKGQMVPCDGIIKEGAAQVDASSLFRDSLSLTKGEGNKVHCGSIVTEGRIIVKSVSTGDSTVLSHYMEQALELNIGHHNDKFYGNKPVYPFLGLNALLAAVAAVFMFKIGGAGEFKAVFFVFVSVITMLFAGASLYANSITQWFADLGMSKYFKVHLAAASSINNITAFVINDCFVDDCDPQELKQLVQTLNKRSVKTILVSSRAQEETEKLAEFLGIGRYYFNFDTKRLLDLYAALKAEGNSLIGFADVYKEISLLKNVDFVFSSDKSSKLTQYFADAHIPACKEFLTAFLNIRKAYRITKQNVWLSYGAYFAVTCICVEAYVSSRAAEYLMSGVYIGFAAALFLMLLNVLRMKRVLKH